MNRSRTRRGCIDGLGGGDRASEAGTLINLHRRRLYDTRTSLKISVRRGEGSESVKLSMRKRLGGRGTEVDGGLK